MSTVIVQDGEQRKNPGCVVQLLWFALVGWWLGQLWIVGAWLAMVSIIALPLGIWMLNRLPKVIALRDPSSAGAGLTITVVEGATVVQVGGAARQRNIIVRALWFLLVGWWLSGIWMEVAYAVCLTIVGLPVGFWMFDRVPAMVSLKR